MLFEIACFIFIYISYVEHMIMRLNLNKLLFATYQPGKGYCRGNHQTRVLGCQFLRSQQLMRMPARREEMELTVDVCQRVGMELSDV